MFRMTFITLVSVYLVLVIFGNGGAESMAQSPAAKTPKEAPTISATMALAQADKVDLVVPAAFVTEEPADQAPSVTPARLAPMPGPALRPSPEYRAQEVPATVTGGTLWAVNSATLNVRSGPSTGNAVIDRLSRGEQVLVTAESNGWMKIRIEGDGIDGWVSKKLLRPAR